MTSEFVDGIGPGAPRTPLQEPAVLAAAYAACESITRHRARNFYYGLKLTPPSKRGAMYAVYAWMRHADDLADADGLDTAERLRRIESLRERTLRLFAGALPVDAAANPTWVAMADTVRRHRLEVEPFLDMLDGQREDVEGRTYESFEELRGFCYRVASTVGLVCIAIWGPSPEAGKGRRRELAIDRGIAFQLTNILRDFREDHERGRVYLPREDFARHGITPEILVGWREPERCAAFMREQLARTEAHYARSAPLDELIDPACRPTLWAMTRIYHGILAKIDAAPCRIAGRRRIRLSSITKALIAFRARRLATSAQRASGSADPAPEARNVDALPATSGPSSSARISGSGRTTVNPGGFEPGAGTALTQGVRQ